jgi:hypothetical protein
MEGEGAPDHITTITPRKIGRRLVLMDCPLPTPYTLTEKEFSQYLCLDVFSAFPGSFRAGATLAEVKRFFLRLLARLRVDHELPYRHPSIVTGAGAPAFLGREHPDGQDVFAVLVVVQEVRTVAALFAVVDRVEAPACAAGHEIEVLAGMAGELAALKGDANHRLTGSEYAALRHRLEDAHAAVEAALVEARRRTRLNEKRDKPQGL